MEDLYKRICKNIKASEIIFLAVLVGYLLSYLLKFQIGQGLLGIPLLIWYPGFFLLSLFSIKNRFGKLGQFSLGVFGSFNLNMLAGHLVQKSYGLNTDIQVLAPTVLCLGLFIAYALNKARRERSEPYSIDKGLVAMIVVAILGFLALMILNPLPQNLDNYLSVLKLSIIKNTNLLGARQIFLAFPALAGKYLSIAPYYLVHYLYYFLFFVSTLFYLDFIKRKGLGALTSWALFLIFFGAPAIITEVYRPMPQVILLSHTFIILILLSESLEYERPWDAVLCLILSGVLILSHELSFIILATSLAVIGVHLYRILFTKKKLSGYLAFIILIILIAVCFIFFKLHFFDRIIFRITEAITSVQKITWHWWFLSDYKTVEGIQLGWRGINALYYYLYSGILVLIALLVARLLNTRQKLTINSLPAIIYFGFFFLSAEILPRIGIFFLPNRAWAHMMIPATLLLTGLLSLKTGKVISYLIIGLSIIGLIGSIYLAKNNIYQIYPKERSLIDAIKKTPSESIILSTQANLTLVDFYGQRRYGQLVTDKELSKQEFEALVDKKLEELSRDQEISYDPDFLQSSLEYTFLPGRRVKIHKSYNPGTPVYLAYSYKKTGGLNDLRDYRQSVVDSNNKFTYEKLGYEVIFNDEAGILIKLK